MFVKVSGPSVMHNSVHPLNKKPNLFSLILAPSLSVAQVSYIRVDDGVLESGYGRQSAYSLLNLSDGGFPIKISVAIFGDIKYCYILLKILKPDAYEGRSRLLSMLIEQQSCPQW